MIVRGTTPEIRFTFSAVDPADITVAYLTIQQNQATIIEKDIDDATIGEDYISWELTQTDALLIEAGEQVRIQCRYKTSDGKAYASRVYTEKPYDVLKEGTI